MKNSINWLIRETHQIKFPSRSPINSHRKVGQLRNSWIDVTFKYLKSITRKRIELIEPNLSKHQNKKGNKIETSDSSHSRVKTWFKIGSEMSRSCSLESNDVIRFRNFDSASWVLRLWRIKKRSCRINSSSPFDGSLIIGWVINIFVEILIMTNQ